MVPGDAARLQPAYPMAPNELTPAPLGNLELKGTRNLASQCKPPVSLAQRGSPDAAFVASEGLVPRVVAVVGLNDTNLGAGVYDPA